MAGVAGLEPVTSAVTGQRSNQLSYTPAKKGGAEVKKCFQGGQAANRHKLSRERTSGVFFKNKFGQQTPRRWGWGTPLKKRAATRIALMSQFCHDLSTALLLIFHFCQ
jgi:hypothetical protein